MGNFQIESPGENLPTRVENQLKVSIITPSFLGAKKVPLLLDELAKQVTDHIWEVVLVLDGDEDGTLDILRHRSYSYPLTIVSLPENQGRASALNAAVTASSGSVILRCDDDLVPGIDFVDRHAKWHIDGPRGVIGLCRNIMETNRYSECYGDQVDIRSRSAAYSAPRELRWRHWAANCSVDRSLWDQVGPYDETFRDYGFEDVDWGFRLMQQGAEIVIDERLEVEHRAASTTSAIRMDRAFRSGRASVYFEQKHGITLQEDLDVTISRRQKIWTLLVLGGARGKNPVGYSRLGSLIDATSRILPKPAARRLIAWGVESAGAGGRRIGQSEA